MPEENNYKCEYCNNILCSVSSLNYHKKTNKKCLLSRDNSINNKFLCADCGFKTQFKHNIKSHKCRQENISIYKNYLITEEKIKELKYTYEEYKSFSEQKIYKLEYELKLISEKNKELQNNLDKYQNQIFALASKPTNNIKIQNLNNVLTSLDFKENTIKEKVDNNFTLEYLNEGIKGVAKFTKEHIINPSEDGKQKYICSDPSRGTFKYKDENGVIQKDVKATKLKNAIQEPIINKTKTLISHETTRIREEGEEKFDITNTKLIDNLMQVSNLDDNGNDYAREMSLVC
jgi:hypothetical protein